jgi:hypothetical protein
MHASHAVHHRAQVRLHGPRQDRLALRQGDLP